MKVKELIQKLQDFDGELEVYTDGDSTEPLFPAATVQEVKAYNYTSGKPKKVVEISWKSK